MRWKTLEEGIQKLREVAVLEVLFGRGGQHDNDPDKVRCTGQMLWNLAALGPSQYATFIATINPDNNRETVASVANLSGLAFTVEPLKHRTPEREAKSPDVMAKDPASRETKSPHDLVTWGRGYACVSTPSGLKWVPANWVKPFIPKSAKPPAEAPQVASAAWRRRKR
ncbi:hypothetical protein DUI87_03238 [Hirundo rustica rustica]|uniref:Integrase-type domain-containing protein n=1 Tax=Hirundo rustica rustica TaxID=333673 RepID=A0A3M0L2L5_HIRRU|nr:hypothetical protein DUI87_03238 [Hirundo rustica rustica]